MQKSAEVDPLRPEDVSVPFSPLKLSFCFIFLGSNWWNSCVSVTEHWSEFSLELWKTDQPAVNLLCCMICALVTVTHDFPWGGHTSICRTKKKSDIFIEYWKYFYELLCIRHRWRYVATCCPFPPLLWIFPGRFSYLCRRRLAHITYLPWCQHTDPKDDLWLGRWLSAVPSKLKLWVPAGRRALYQGICLRTNDSRRTCSMCLMTVCKVNCYELYVKKIKCFIIETNCTCDVLVKQQT